MSALPAYRSYAEPSTSPRRQPRISVVPGGRPAQKTQSLSSTLLLVAKVGAIVMVVLALLGFARVSLSSATVSTSLETRALSSEINAIRSEGSALEVTQSTMANPVRIRELAQNLGMGPAEAVTYIDLGNDVVVTDSTGALSLSGSVAALNQG